MKLASDRWVRGLIRLYIVLTVPWVMGCGYLAYKAHRVYAFNRDHVNAVDATPGTNHRNYALSAILRDEFHRKRDFDLEWLPVVPVGLPILLVAFGWIRAGFRRAGR